MDDRLFQLKILLRSSKPPIWRRFIVPSCITLHDLHFVIQHIMGWYNCHLYEFYMGMYSLEGDPESFENEIKSNRFRLNEFINEDGSKFDYLYDFGDGWWHKLLLENSNYINPKIKPDVYCLKGRRACPPENSGGIHHYSHISSDLDEKPFEVERVNKRIKTWIPWYKEGYIKWKSRMCAS